MNMNTYLTSPNLPDSKVSEVLVDYRISSDAENELMRQGIEVKKTMPHPCLYQAVNGHPDMQIHHLNKNKFICEEKVFDYYKKLLPDAEILKGSSVINEKYPSDISYNAALVGNYLFHNFKYTDLKLYEYYKACGVKLSNVKQGYSKCSVCIISDDAIITSDKIIAQEAVKINIDVLYINPEEIRLSGLSNGLVGGIAGLIDKNVLAVNGNIMLLKDGNSFAGFCKNHGIDILALSNKIPEDIGSIIPIKQNMNICSGKSWARFK